MRISRTIMALALFALLMIPAVFAADIQCAQCGMTVDHGSKFTAKLAAGDVTLFFCDVGDLFSYLKKKNLGPGGAFVKDYPGGEWVAAIEAFFVHDEKKFKTPMGWGVAAYRDRGRAAEAGKAMDFDAAAKAMQ